MLKEEKYSFILNNSMLREKKSLERIKLIESKIDFQEPDSENIHLLIPKKDVNFIEDDIMETEMNNKKPLEIYPDTSNKKKSDNFSIERVNSIYIKKSSISTKYEKSVASNCSTTISKIIDNKNKSQSMNEEMNNLFFKNRNISYIQRNKNKSKTKLLKSIKLSFQKYGINQKEYIRNNKIIFRNNTSMLENKNHRTFNEFTINSQKIILNNKKNAISLNKKINHSLTSSIKNNSTIKSSKNNKNVDYKIIKKEIDSNKYNLRNKIYSQKILAMKISKEKNNIYNIINHSSNKIKKTNNFKLNIKQLKKQIHEINKKNNEKNKFFINSIPLSDSRINIKKLNKNKEKNYYIHRNISQRQLISINNSKDNITYLINNNKFNFTQEIHKNKNMITNTTTNNNINENNLNKENGKNNDINKFRQDTKNFFNKRTYSLIDCRKPSCSINKCSRNSLLKDKNFTMKNLINVFY